MCIAAQVPAPSDIAKIASIIITPDTSFKPTAIKTHTTINLHQELHNPGPLHRQGPLLPTDQETRHLVRDEAEVRDTEKDNRM